MNSLVSVIINVYNAEQYLIKCIVSVLNQSYRELEIILINDGSKDSSGEICDRYAQQDERIKVIHQKNMGICYSRNVGIEVSTGEFIFFVDCDDWIEPSCIEQAVKGMTDFTDIALVLKNNVFEDDWKDDVTPDTKKIEYISDSRDKFILVTERYKMWEVWGKLYRKELFVNYKFLESSTIEDLQLIPLLILEAREIVLIPINLYNYLHRQNSYSFKKITAGDIISSANPALSYIKEHYNFQTYKMWDEFYLGIVLQYAKKKRSFGQKKEVVDFFLKHKIDDGESWGKYTQEIETYCS